MDADVVTRLAARAAAERGRVVTAADGRFADGWEDVCAWLSDNRTLDVSDVVEQASALRQSAGGLPLQEAHAHGFFLAAELAVTLANRGHSS